MHPRLGSVRVPQPQREYDAIVVGSGMTGGWAAKELCERGLNTLVLEAGRPIDPKTDYVEHVRAWEMPYRGYGDRKALERNQPVQKKCYACDEWSSKFFVNDMDVRAVGRTPRPAEAKRMLEFLASQRRLYQADSSLARRLLRNERAAQEAEQVSAVEPVGAQSAVGRADSLAMAARKDAVKQAALKATQAHDALSDAEAIELAAWTGVARVLLNIDDFVTRN
jgi:glycine/D-amino acid oxidase-like deaminating enzyme